MSVQPALAPQADNPPAMSAQPPVLELFHPAVAGWFARAFPGPTEAQQQAWPSIEAGRHTLVAAPTGDSSGCHERSRLYDARAFLMHFKFV